MSTTGSAVPAASCPACQSRAARPIGSIPDCARFAGRILSEVLPGGTLYECADCALWFRYPRLPKPILDQLYAQGASDIWSNGTTLRRDWDRTVSALRRHMPKGRVLDIGCFDGELLSRLGKGYELYGVELNRQAVAIARQRGVNILEQDFDNLGRCNMRFDAIIATDVLEHSYNPFSLLSDCARLLSPGGILLMSTGTTDAWTWKLMGGRYWYCANAEHVSFANAAWVRKAGARLQLDEVFIEQFAHDRAAGLAVKQVLSNTFYRLAPTIMTRVKERVFKAPRSAVQAALHASPPSWSTARDHMVFGLRARGAIAVSARQDTVHA